MSNVVINPADFETRLKEAYASKDQMVRDTDDGLRYLVPEADNPGERTVENKLSRKSLFGIAGAFYQRGQDYPFPLLGLQYFNFDMWGKGKQLSVFFAGALLFANYTDPAFLGTHFDVGADVFAVAFPFVETSYRNGVEVRSERIKQMPESFQVNIGHPIGPYFKASDAAVRAVRLLQARPGHGDRVHHARLHVHLRRRAQAQLERGRLQHRGPRRLLLAREVGGVGRPAHLRVRPELRRTTGSTRSTSPRASTSPSSASSSSRSPTSGARTSTAFPSGTSARSRRTA